MQYFIRIFPPVFLALLVLVQTYWRFFDGVPAWILIFLGILGIVWALASLVGHATAKSFSLAICMTLSGGLLALTALPSGMVSGEASLPFGLQPCGATETAAQCQVRLDREALYASARSTGSIFVAEDDQDFQATPTSGVQESDGVRIAVGNIGNRNVRFSVKPECDGELAKPQVTVRQKKLSAAFGMHAGYAYVLVCS